MLHNYKPILFLKWKPNDIHTNVFGIHVEPLWGRYTYLHNIF